MMSIATREAFVHPRLIKYWRIIIFAAGVLGLSLASTAAAANYDGQNPVQAGCTNGAQSVGGEDAVAINDLSATTQILSSPSCPYAVWVAVNVSSGANGQYRVAITLSGGNSGGSVHLEEVVSSSLIQSSMLNDENSCITASVSIKSLNGDTDSTTEDQVCRRGFVGLVSPIGPSAPGQTTTTTSTSSTSVSGTSGQTTNSTSSGGSSQSPRVHKVVRHRKCFGRHHRRVKCRKHSKHKKS